MFACRFSFIILFIASNACVFVYILNRQLLRDSQEGTFGSEHSASPSQGSSQQHFLEPEANLDDSIDIQQQEKVNVFLGDKVLKLISEKSLKIW